MSLMIVRGGFPVRTAAMALPVTPVPAMKELPASSPSKTEVTTSFPLLGAMQTLWISQDVCYNKKLFPHHIPT